jgi:hypothetical protein
MEMSPTFFRIQEKGYSLQDMQKYKSCDGSSEAEKHDGLCASESIEDLRRYISGWAIGDMSMFEIVVFKGRKLDKLYDGVLAEPREIIARYEFDYFMNDNNDEELVKHEDCW